jgi:quinone-modifying oxidoreductase subunit QmoB
MANDKTAVYVCSGCAIGEAVDTDALVALAEEEFKVARAAAHEFLCGDEGLATIQNDLAGETGIESVVVCACSPRVMADRFRFEGVQVVRGNLREQVAWCHEPGDEDTQMKAADNLRMAVTQAEKSSPPEPHEAVAASRRLLVVGGGSSGLAAGREAARAGYEAVIVEQAAELGGRARGFSKVLPSHPPYREPEANPIAELIAEVEGDGRISVRTGTTVASTAGGPGDFRVTLANGTAQAEETFGAIVVATGWRPYDAGKLGHLGYGTPGVVTNVELEELLAKGEAAPKAVAFVQCAGSRDAEHLPYCSQVCCGVSIKQALQLRQADPETMIYVIFDELRTPGTAEEFYRAAQEAGVVFMKGKVKSVGADLTVTVDDALLGEEVPLGGLDMVVLATGMVPNATTDGELLPDPDIDPLAPIARAGDEAAEEMPEESPSADGDEDEEAAALDAPRPENSILNLQYRQGPHLPNLADGFADSHYICFPYETRRTGIYGCGPLRRPMDMGEAAEDAAGAVLKAIQAMEQAVRQAAVHPRVGDLSYPKIGLDICTKCRRCTVECPFGAIDENDEGFPVLTPTRCRRCGTCMGACPVRTISFDNYSVEMINAMSKAVEIPDEFDEKPRVLVLACENDAYPALDRAGIQGRKYSSMARVIPVRCLGSVSLVMISDALSSGYDGVLLLGCKSGDDYQCHFVKGSAMAQERVTKIGETLKSMMLEGERVTTHEIAITDAEGATQIIDDFVASIDEIGMNPFKGF